MPEDLGTIVINAMTSESLGVVCCSCTVVVWMSIAGTCTRARTGSSSQKGRSVSCHRERTSHLLVTEVPSLLFWEGDLLLFKIITVCAS